jgi:uncharacterized protein YbjT (DUF2867 family)
VSAQKRVLVVGGTGTVGRHAVRELLERGAAPLVLVRGPRTLPAGAVPVAGDALDAAAVDEAVGQADAVIFIAPHETYDVEKRMTENVLDACARRGIPATYFSVGLPGASRITRFLFGLLIGLFFSHYKPRIKLAQRAFLHPARPHIIGSGCFCQCTDYFVDDILAGTYTEPAGPKPLTRVDAYDIGAALAIVALGPKEPRVISGVEGAEAITGPQAAEIWAAALERPVVYAGGHNDQWERSLARTLENPKLDQYIKTLRLLPRAWAPVSKRRLRNTTVLLGRPPRSYRDYVKDKVAELRALEQSPVSKTQRPGVMHA